MQFDRWSLPVIGEALLRGTTRRDEFLTFLGVAPDVLDSRLNSLVAAGILSAERGTDGEVHFVPTEKGRGLETALRALDQWSRDWDPLSTGDVLEVVDVLVGGHDVPAAATIELRLLGTFDLLIDGDPVDLSPGSQRLLVFLALRDRAIARIALAGTMWPDVSEGRAGDSLRSAIARLEPPARSAIRMSSMGLRIGEAVTVDLRDAQALAHRLIGTGTAAQSDLGSTSITTLSRELLPDWYDDWVLAEAEDWRYLRMNALEALARRLLDDGQLGEAATAARTAIRVDPLRETPHLLLVRIQLAMGNQSAALGVVGQYQSLLGAAGLTPSRQFAELVQGISS